jgi:hypothetical protein
VFVIGFEAISTFSSNALASLLEHCIVFVGCSRSLQGICFGDDEASQFRTLEERYHFLSDDKCVCSFLACAKFIHGVDTLPREPLFVGEPVLTAIHALAVALAGKSVSGEAAWPDVPFLSPIGWQKPTGLIDPFIGSTVHCLNSSTTMQCTRSPFLESIVLGFEDLSTFALGWMTYDWQISPSSHPFVTDDFGGVS